MDLPYEAVVNGISVMIFVIVGWIIGIAFIVKSRSSQAKLLFYYGLGLIFGVSNWLGTFLDFIFVILTNENIGITLAILGYATMPLGITFVMYVFAELIAPQKKYLILSFYIILGIVFEILLFIKPTYSVRVIYPSVSGSDLIDLSVKIGTPLFFMSLIFQMSALIFLGFGFLIKGILSKGLLRKKFLLLSIGWFIFVACAMIDNLINPGVFIILVRIGLISNGYFSYMGLREEPIKTENSKATKEVEIEKSLFRLYKNRAEITEEEITYHREKKICLVCKSPAIKYTYICPKCEALYCQNCAQTLESIENACWVCLAPIDENKPTKPYIESKQELKVEVEEKKKLKE